MGWEVTKPLSCSTMEDEIWAQRFHSPFIYREDVANTRMMEIRSIEFPQKQLRRNHFPIQKDFPPGCRTNIKSTLAAMCIRPFPQPLFPSSPSLSTPYHQFTYSLLHFFLSFSAIAQGRMIMPGKEQRGKESSGY